MFQSKHLRLAEKWLEIKIMYVEANVVLGDIPKATPSSNVVGYLYQFMVSQDQSLEDVSNRVKDLEFLGSVVQYLRG